MHQTNFKWKDMQKKFNDIKSIFDQKMNSRASGKHGVDILKSTQRDYRKLCKIKLFLQEATWDILKFSREMITR